MRALIDIVLTSSFFDKYAGARMRNSFGVVSVIAMPTPWNLDFSPFANVQGISFLCSDMKYSSRISM